MSSQRLIHFYWNFRSIKLPEASILITFPEDGERAADDYKREKPSPDVSETKMIIQLWTVLEGEQASIQNIVKYDHDDFYEKRSASTLKSV